MPCVQFRELNSYLCVFLPAFLLSWKKKKKLLIIVFEILVKTGGERTKATYKTFDQPGAKM